MNALEFVSEPEMRTYEISVVVSPVIEDKTREALLDSIRKMVSALGGQVTRTDEDGKKALAYSIEGHGEAWYYFLIATMPADKINDLDTKLKLEDSVIRHLIVKEGS